MNSSQITRYYSQFASTMSDILPLDRENQSKWQTSTHDDDDVVVVADNFEHLEFIRCLFKVALYEQAFKASALTSETYKAISPHAKKWLRSKYPKT